MGKSNEHNNFDDLEATVDACFIEYMFLCKCLINYHAGNETSTLATIKVSSLL